MRLSNNKLKKLGWISVIDVVPIIGNQYLIQNLTGNIKLFTKEYGGWRLDDNSWMWDADVQYYLNP